MYLFQNKYFEDEHFFSISVSTEIWIFFKFCIMRITATFIVEKKSDLVSHIVIC